MELLIGEDRYQDLTLAKCRKWQRGYPALIRIVTAEQSAGRHRNFARNWQRARGESVAFCEGDDCWTDPGKLQQQVDWFHSIPVGALVDTFTERIAQNANGDWQVTGRSAPYETKPENYLQDLLQGYSFHFSSVMLRKSAVRYPRWFWEAYCVDRPLYLLAAQNGAPG